MRDSRYAMAKHIGVKPMKDAPLQFLWQERMPEVLHLIFWSMDLWKWEASENKAVEKHKKATEPVNILLQHAYNVCKLQ